MVVVVVGGPAMMWLFAGLAALYLAVLGALILSVARIQPPEVPEDAPSSHAVEAHSLLNLL